TGSCWAKTPTVSVGRVRPGLGRVNTSTPMGLPPGRPCPPCDPEDTQANIQLGPLQNGVLDLSWQGRPIVCFLGGLARRRRQLAPACRRSQAPSRLAPRA